MSREMEHLQVEVARATSVMQSATTLITTISGHIRDNAEDPVALNQLADQLDASAASLAGAVTENTAAANLGSSDAHPSQADSATGDGGAAAAGAAETGTGGADDTSGASGGDDAGGASSGAEEAAADDGA